jgi:ABC-type phosphate transport system permease subunit
MAHLRKGIPVAGDEPVTSPDQHKPTISAKLSRFGAVVTILALLAMTFGNHEGNIENLYLIAGAGLLLLILILDFILRRNGLRSDD